MSGLWFVLIYAIALVLLLAASAFFSGSETALFSLGRAEVRRMSGGSIGERAVFRLLSSTQALLSTILIGNNLVNVLVASLVAELSRHLFPAHSVGVAIGTSTLLLLIFGEITPKTLAIYHSRRWAVLLAPVLWWCSRLLTPLRKVLETTVNFLLVTLGHTPVSGWNPLTPEEIAAASAAGAAAGTATREEHRLVERLLEFANLQANDIMVPRTEIRGVSDRLTLREAFSEAARQRHSRLPVYHRDFDDIWGLVAIVDLPRWRGHQFMDMPLAKLRPLIDGGAELPVHKAAIVPEAARLNHLLPAAIAQKTHMLVAVDEYGGTAGLLSLHGILGAIMGEAAASQQKQRIVEAGQDRWFVDGRTHLRELNEILPVPVEVSEADTVSGHVMELLGRIAHAGDEIGQECYRFRVLSMIGNRIGLVQIERLALPETAEEGETC